MAGTLAEKLAEAIRRDGPLTVEAFMAAALSDPEHGYYATRDPFGAAGDFTTAPEISQMFGELVGLWCAVTWQMIGSPSRVILAEMGPGRGTLMADALRALATVPPFLAAAEVWLVETSPTLRQRQRQTLAGRDIRWAERFEDLPSDAPLLMVANELFDALPILQYQKQGGHWHERRVGLTADGGFAFVLGSEATPDLPAEVLDAPDGAIAEDCPQGRALAAAIGKRVAGFVPGAALLIDYGHGLSAAGDTLQAVKAHKFHPVLEAPGSADLTAHVDFAALARAAYPARAHGPAGQGAFLSRLGIQARAAMLAKGAPATAEQVEGQLRRLIDPREMGTLFKVMGLAHPALPTLPGLEA